MRRNQVGKRKHVFIWDKNQDQKFLDLSGNFLATNDKQLRVNPEYYHLMNTHAQKAQFRPQTVDMPNPFVRLDMNQSV